MAIDSQPVRVAVTADASQAKTEITSFADRVAAASAAVKGSFAGIASSAAAMHGQMKSDLTKAEGVIESVQKRFAAWAALLAGGKVLKESIQATVNFTKEANTLARVLSINTTEAAALNVALGDVYSSADDMAAGAAKLTKQLRTNEDALVAMGLKTRDASGAFRPMNDLMMDSIRIVNGYREGTDRAMAQQTLFGKGAEEMTGLMRLNNEVIEAARIKQVELGLVVGVENVEAAKRFRAMMNDVGDVMLGIKKAIGDAVMPMFTQLGEWFTGKGEYAVTAIKGSMGGLVSVFWGLKNAVVIAWEAVYSFLYSINEPLRSLSVALYKLVQGDFKGATDEMLTWTDRVGQRWATAWQTMVESSEQSRDKIYELFAAPTPTASKERSGKEFQPAPDGATRMAGWEAELDRQKVAHERLQAEAGTFYEFGKEREANYWQAILGTLGAADKERFAVQKKYYALVLDMRKGDFAAEQAELQTRIEGAKGNYVEQELLAEMYADRARQRYGANSKEYQDALRRLQALYRQHYDALREVENIGRQRSRDDQLEDVAAMERAAELERALGTLTQLQLLEVKRRGLEMRRAIELEAKQAEIEAMRGNPNADPVALEKLEQQLAEIRRKYKGLGQQNQGDQVTEQAKPLDAFFGASQSSIEQGLQSMVTNMKVTMGGLRDTARQVGASLLQELITKPFAAWVIGQARMVAMTAIFGQQRVALEAVAAAETTAVQGSSTLAVIAMKAYEAAAGAYSAIAGIPYVGPVLAPVAAGVALAGVMAFAKNIFSAENGFDIPKGMNPMTQLHSNEMVLPSRHADTMRALGDIVATNGTLAAGGSNTPLQVIPGPGDFFLVNRKALFKAFAHGKRNNEF